MGPPLVVARHRCPTHLPGLGERPKKVGVAAFGSTVYDAKAAVGTCQCLSHQAKRGHKQGYKKPGPEARNMEPMDEFCHKQQGQRVDHEQKKTKGYNGERQSQDNQDWPHDGIDQAQEQTRYPQGAGAVEVDPRKHVGGDPEGQGIERPYDEHGRQS